MELEGYRETLKSDIQNAIEAQEQLDGNLAEEYNKGREQALKYALMMFDKHFDVKPAYVSNFGFGKYNCPKCGERHCDKDDGYEINQQVYPLMTNERKGSTPDGNYHDWTEHHKCLKCGTEFNFENGAY